MFWRIMMVNPSFPRDFLGLRASIAWDGSSFVSSLSNQLACLSRIVNCLAFLMCSKLVSCSLSVWVSLQHPCFIFLHWASFYPPHYCLEGAEECQLHVSLSAYETSWLSVCLLCQPTSSLKKRVDSLSSLSSNFPNLALTFLSSSCIDGLFYWY